jgi:hypothetical protein
LRHVGGGGDDPPALEDAWSALEMAESRACGRDARDH